jgi:hypothetical protein
MALGSTQPLTEMSTTCFPGGKGGHCVRLTTLPPSCSVVMKSGNLNFLELSGPLQACNGTALPLPFMNVGYVYTHTHTHTQTYVYRVSQEECAILRESVPYVKLYRYNPKHLYPKLNGYKDNGHRKVGLVLCPRTVAVRDAVHVHCA